MGDPKRIRKKYDTPVHPWIKSRIEDERRLTKEFGTKNKKELWKMETTLKNFKKQAKKLITLNTTQAEVETQHLFRRVKELGLISGEPTFDGILSLTVDDIMARRLQSVVLHKELARSVKQARQFITHEHVVIGDQVITSPSYLVSVEQEAQVGFTASSGLFKEDHPERADPKELLAKKQAAEAAKEVTESEPVASETENTNEEAPKAESAPEEEAPAAENTTEEAASEESTQEPATEEASEAAKEDEGEKQ